MQIDAPGMPFRHLALPLGDAPVRLGAQLGGRRMQSRTMRHCVGMIEAGAAGESWWDAPLKLACFYVLPQALARALDREAGVDAHLIRCNRGQPMPEIARLLRAVHADAVAGQPHGRFVGDAIFVTLAARRVPGHGDGHAHGRPSGSDWRVRRALEIIHARLTDALDIPDIADAAAASPFHLSRLFRAAMGCSIWQYVLRERARHALELMREPRLGLSEVADRAGFATYAGFIAALRSEFGQAPARLRRNVIRTGR